MAGPTITLQPQSQTKRAGENVLFVITATGVSDMTIAWYRNGTLIVGAASFTYTRENLTLDDDASTYYAIVTDFSGSTQSVTATLTITINDTSRLENALFAIQDEFQRITLANRFRNDLIPSQVICTIRHPAVIMTHPEIGIACVSESIMPTNDPRTVFASLADIRVCGRVKPAMDLANEATKMNEALESLAHDMRRVVAVMTKKYIVNATSPWVIADDGKFQVQRNTVSTPTRGFAEVVVTFQILLRNQDVTFS